MVEGKEDEHGEIQVHAQIFPDKSEIKDYLDKEPTEEEVKAIVKKVIDNVNNSVPGFKKIKSYYIRTTEFVMTTTKKIKRNENKE